MISRNYQTHWRRISLTSTHGRYSLAFISPRKRFATCFSWQVNRAEWIYAWICNTLIRAFHAETRYHICIAQFRSIVTVNDSHPSYIVWAHFLHVMDENHNIFSISRNISTAEQDPKLHKFPNIIYFRTNLSWYWLLRPNFLPSNSMPRIENELTGMSCKKISVDSGIFNIPTSLTDSLCHLTQRKRECKY